MDRVLAKTLLSSKALTKVKAFVAPQVTKREFVLVSEVRVASCESCDRAMLQRNRPKLSDLVEAQFYLLVDYHHQQVLPVLASSNCRKEGLAQRLDWRVRDRLRERCTMVEAVGPNLRDRAVQRAEMQDQRQR